MQSESEELPQAAVGALRNIVFENNENKMEVKDCEGLPVILRLLKENRDIETRRQLTGKGSISGFKLCAIYIFHYAIKLGSTLDDPAKNHAIRKTSSSWSSSLPLILQMLFSLQGCCGICLLMTSWKSSLLEMQSNLSQIVCWCPAPAFLKGKTPSWSSLLTLTFSTTLLAAWGIANLKRKYNRF